MKSISTEMHHYTECGLGYVWLKGGYSQRQTAYGPAVAFDDVDGLHREIARFVVERIPELRGAEVKFLRLEMALTQAELGAQLGVSEQTVSLWERKPEGPMPATPQKLLRLLAEGWLDTQQPLKAALTRTQQAPQQAPVVRQSFRRSRNLWKAAA